jgi:hypothetical protein
VIVQSTGHGFQSGFFRMGKFNEGEQRLINVTRRLRHTPGYRITGIPKFIGVVDDLHDEADGVRSIHTLSLALARREFKRHTLKLLREPLDGPLRRRKLHLLNAQRHFQSSTARSGRTLGAAPGAGATQLVIYVVSAYSTCRCGHELQASQAASTPPAPGENMIYRIIWRTSNFDGHHFTIHNPNANWSDTGGIYIFAKRNKDSTWKAIYIGQTHSFKERLSNHPQWEDAVLMEVTHIHLLTIQQEATRLSVEKDLIQKYHPALNQQLKKKDD